MLVLFLVLLMLRAQSGVRRARCCCIWQAESCLVWVSKWGQQLLWYICFSWGAVRGLKVNVLMWLLRFPLERGRLSHSHHQQTSDTGPAELGANRPATAQFADLRRVELVNLITHLVVVGP